MSAKQEAFSYHSTVVVRTLDETGATIGDIDTYQQASPAIAECVAEAINRRIVRLP